MSRFGKEHRRSRVWRFHRLIIETVEEGNRYEAEMVAAMSKALSYIQGHLDEPLEPSDLADLVCFSYHHFHRVFRGVVGESVMNHIRRLRLEKAAYRLRATRESVGLIGLDAGYGSQEAFTRVFQAHFGIPPRMFRRTHAHHILPTASGIHYSRLGYSPLKRAVEPELLDDAGLCPAHRHPDCSDSDHLQRLLKLLAGFYFSELSTLPLGSPSESRTLMNQNVTDIDKEIDGLLAEIESAKERLAAAHKKRPKEAVSDYVLKSSDGEDVRLSDLFGGKEDMIVIHNMGSDCIYCTVWADGLTGLVPHFADRTALVVCSPDTPEVQKRFAAKRNWTFTMVSAAESPFTKDMGLWQEDGPNAGPWPGISVFKKEADGSVSRIGKSFLGPAYDCAVWPLFEMLDGGPNGWEPKYEYGGKP